MKVYEINFEGSPGINYKVVFTEKDIDKFQGVLRRLRMGENIKLTIEEGYLSEIIEDKK